MSREVWTCHGWASYTLVWALGLRDDYVGVVQEGTGTQMVVVDALGVSLQITLHVLWIEGKVGAQHGRQGRGGGVG